MNDGRIHIALVANERYRPGLLATRHSMTSACADPSRLVFHEFGDADMAPFESRFPLREWNGSKLPYLRLFLPEILPDCDWIIYSDVDTLWFRDPQELWKERDDTVSICWVKDFPAIAMEFDRWAAANGLKIPPGHEYACSGVALLNLRKWRETGFTARAIDFFRTYGCPPYPDQDALNVLSAGDAKIIDHDWDVMIPARRWRPCVLHLTGVGLRFAAGESYDGNVPQYVFWFAYYRQNILHLPPKPLRLSLKVRFTALKIISLAFGALLEALDRHAGPYRWKQFLMRVKRQTAFAGLALRPALATSKPLNLSVAVDVN